MEGYDAVVYDLDGTLVSLDVDWATVRHETALKLRARGFDVDGDDLWDLLDLGDREGLSSLVEETIAEHERSGARTSERLPTAETLSAEIPTGVCSLNAESACRIALEIHGLDNHVDVIVGRDSLDSRKPDPEPLEESIRRLSATPATSIFVGDSRRDALTADRAGVDFRRAESE